MQTLLHALVQFPQEIPDIARSTSEALKVWLALAGIGLLLAWSVIQPTRRRWVLVVLAVVACANYLRFGPRLLFQNTDNYDLFHYYLNSKYFDELGYYDLYPAGILVAVPGWGPVENRPYGVRVRLDSGSTVELGTIELQEGYGGYGLGRIDPADVARVELLRTDTGETICGADL